MVSIFSTPGLSLINPKVISSQGIRVQAYDVRVVPDGLEMAPFDLQTY